MSGCCGGVRSRVDQIKRTAGLLAAGHKAVAAIYRSLADDKDATPADRAAFAQAAADSESLAESSLKVTMPDDLADEVEKEQEERRG